MRFRYLAYSFGLTMTYFGLLVCIPIVVSLIYKEYQSMLPFLLTSILAISTGYILQKLSIIKGEIKNLNDIKKSEGLFIVTISWVLAGIIAGIPYTFYGLSIYDALFESVSGITTTGATIFTHFNYPHAIMFWRSFTQWLGGMGIIVLFIAILPQFAVAGRQMFFAEAPGPTEDKFTPRIRSTASSLWVVYAGLTLLEIVCLIVAGMPVFDSVCNSLSTVAAGGFSPNPDSIMGYHSNYITWIVLFFMFLAGSSFNLQHRAYSKLNPFLMWKNEEFRVYFWVSAGITILVATSLFLNDHFSIFDSITNGAYQVISLMTSTGSASSDYTHWDFSTQILLFLTMFTGACASSTGGGIKIVRWILLYKIMKVELKKILHPNAILNIKINDTIIQKDVLTQTITFFMFYFGITFISILLITLIEHNFIIGISAPVSAIGNIGPAFGHSTGPMSNFESLHNSSKLILTFNMLIGRLELIPFLVFLEKDFYNFKID